MERYNNDFQALERRTRRLATLASNVMACAGLLLVAIMISGWVLTW